MPDAPSAGQDERSCREVTTAAWGPWGPWGPWMDWFHMEIFPPGIPHDDPK